MMTEGTPIMYSDSGWGGNSFIWAFLIFALLGFGNNGWGNNNGRGFEQYATSSDVQRGFDTQDINGQLRGITYGLSDVGYAVDNKIEGAKDYLSASIGSTKDAVTSEGRGIQMQLANCCCDNQRNVDSVRFDMANYTASINANTTAQTQKVLDAISQNKIESLQGQINQLQLQNAMCGVVRFPNSWAYNAGNSPFCNNGCGSY